MKTFALQNGDLVLGAEGFATVSGQSKIRQELGAAMREPLGVDRFHPNWGSQLPAFIGIAVGHATSMHIRAEVYRVIQSYVSLLAEGVRRDNTRGESPRYVANEVIKDVVSVDVVQQYDRFHVRVSLRTLADQSVTLIQTVRA